MTPTFYILHGDDEFSLKDHLTKLQASINDPSQLNTTHMDGNEVSARAVISAVCAYPFLSDARLVVVRNMLGGKRKADTEMLVDELPTLPDFARLVFHEDKTLPESHAIMKLAKSDPNGQVKHFAAPSHPKEMAPLLEKMAKGQGVSIEPQAVLALATVVPGDLRAADSEIAKLAAYVNYSRAITEADVEAMTAYVAEANIFELVDAIGQQNGRLAFTLMQRFLSEKGNEPLQIMAMIGRQFRLLILAREYLDYGGEGTMASALGVTDFVARKVGGQAKRFASVKQLEDIYRKLADLDDRIKTGRIDDETALQTFVAGITQ